MGDAVQSVEAFRAPTTATTGQRRTRPRLSDGCPKTVDRRRRACDERHDQGKLLPSNECVPSGHVRTEPNLDAMQITRNLKRWKPTTSSPRCWRDGPVTVPGSMSRFAQVAPLELRSGSVQATVACSLRWEPSNEDNGESVPQGSTRTASPDVIPGET